MLIIIFIIIISFIIIFRYQSKILTTKKIITTGKISISLFILSFVVGKNISDVKKKNYEEIFDNYVNKLHIFNFEEKIFLNMHDFEKDFWIALTDDKNYEYYTFINPLFYFVNEEYFKTIKFLFKNIIMIIKIPWFIYKIHKESSSKEEIFSKLVLTHTITKIYQISLIMNTDINLVIKRIRIARNIPIIDKNTGKKMITRQVKSPMIASEVCPFINHIKKCKTSFNIKLNYSILLIDKKRIIEICQYKCIFHETCVLYKDENDVVKHLEDCEFWYNDKYWENKYPIEREEI